MARVVRFMFEWGHEWPLWESGSEKYTMEPADYGLSPELTVRLRSVYDFWLAHFHHEDGWDSPATLAVWRAEKRQALAILRREVADFADVKDESGAGGPRATQRAHMPSARGSRLS